MENWYKYKILTLDLGGSREPCCLPAGIGRWGDPRGTFGFLECAYFYSGHRNF